MSEADCDASLPLLVVIAGLVGVWLGASIFASIS